MCVLVNVFQSERSSPRMIHRVVPKTPDKQQKKNSFGFGTPQREPPRYVDKEDTPKARVIIYCVLNLN